MTVTTWGTWLRQKRGSRGDPGFISQVELARRMKVSRTYVAQLEEQDDAPTYPTRQKIHAALGTTEDELVELGIVRDRRSRPESLQRVRDEGDPLVALISTFSPRQRAMLLDLLDRANARALEQEADASEPERKREP